MFTIDELVQRMQEMPEAQVSQNLSNPQATDVRQLTIRRIVVNGYDTAEWIYTATDTGWTPRRHHRQYVYSASP